MRMNEILPDHVRDFLRRLQTDGASAHTLARCKTVLSAIFTTALNDQVIYFHPCTGVKVPSAPKRPLRILPPTEFNAIIESLSSETWKLLVELALESGVRWGELTELRPCDFHAATRTLTIARTVVEVHPPSTPGQRFVVKHYPKNAEYRQLRLSSTLTTRIAAHIRDHDLGDCDLLFPFPANDGKDPAPGSPSVTLGELPPLVHGSLTHYNQGCRCTHCRHALAAYRATRRAQGKDHPNQGRNRETDGHLPRDWYRLQIWYPAQNKAGLTRRVRMHDLRHTHASWLLAGGADVEIGIKIAGACTVQPLRTLDVLGSAQLGGDVLGRGRGSRLGAIVIQYTWLTRPTSTTSQDS